MSACDDFDQPGQNAIQAALRWSPEIGGVSVGGDLFGEETPRFRSFSLRLYQLAGPECETNSRAN